MIYDLQSTIYHLLSTTSYLSIYLSSSLRKMNCFRRSRFDGESAASGCWLSLSCCLLTRRSFWSRRSCPACCSGGWRPLIAGCLSLQGLVNGLAPNPCSLGFEPQTSCIWADPSANWAIGATSRWLSLLVAIFCPKANSVEHMASLRDSQILCAWRCWSIEPRPTASF